MSLEVELGFPASPDRVFRLFSDPEVVTAKYESAGATGVTLDECGPDGTGFRLTTTRTVASPVPAFAAKLLPSRNTITQTERWGPEVDGARAGEWEVSVHGVPIRMRGSMSLTGDDGSTRYRVSGEVTVGIPLIGRRLAGFVVEDLEAKLASEHRFGTAWLGGAK
ncbi:MAG: DUF2505 domain-containing protein [Acidimicrobiia bacterium]